MLVVLLINQKDYEQCSVFIVLRMLVVAESVLSTKLLQVIDG